MYKPMETILNQRATGYKWFQRALTVFLTVAWIQPPHVLYFLHISGSVPSVQLPNQILPILQGSTSVTRFVTTFLIPSLALEFAASFQVKHSLQRRGERLLSLSIWTSYIWESQNMQDSQDPREVIQAVTNVEGQDYLEPLQPLERRSLALLSCLKTLQRSPGLRL